MALEGFLQFMAFIGVDTCKISCPPNPMLKTIYYERTEI